MAGISEEKLLREHTDGGRTDQLPHTPRLWHEL